MADAGANAGVFSFIRDMEEPMRVNEEKGNSGQGPYHTKRFPEKLFEAASDESSDLIAWSPDGTSLYVHEDRFEQEVLAVYPGLVCVKTFTNFRRQLREYGFDWRQNNVQMLFHFSHPSFRRDAPRLAKSIETRRRGRTKQTLANPNAKDKGKNRQRSDFLEDSDSNGGVQIIEGQEGIPQMAVPLRNLTLAPQPSPLMSCAQQTQSPLTYHVMPMVQPTQAYFIPFSQGHQQELGGSGDHKKSDKENEPTPPSGAPLATSQGHQPSAPPMPMMSMVPSSGGLSYGVYFPQCAPWMQHFGSNVCGYPFQPMAAQSDGSVGPRVNMQSQSAPSTSSQWQTSSPEPRKKKMKLDFDWYGRITPVESTSPDRNSTSSSMSTCASKGSPPHLDQ